MKKLLIVIAVLSLAFMNSCKGESNLKNTSTESIVSTSITRINSESVQRKMDFLSKQFDFVEDVNWFISARMEQFGVKDIKKIDIAKDGDRYNVIRITDVTDGIYYMTLTKPHGHYGKNVLTAEEWELAQKHVQFFLERFDFREFETEGTAEQLVISGIKEIKELVVEYEGGGGYIMRVKDIADEVYYLILDRNGDIETIHKGSRTGEPIYRSFY